jgi:glycosyltransferase involved in cell wall biosynthesis
MKILFVHLLNNYSGSPQVLANILKELCLYKEYNISLLTSRSDGCLSNISNIIYHNNHYKWSNSRLLLLFRFLFSQVYMFIFILLKINDIDIIYINTILPFSVAIAGKFKCKKILYHIHEVYIKPNILQKIMWIVMEKNADKIISVSKYVSEHINRESIVIYNSTSREFEFTAKKIINEASNQIITQKFSKKNILMISSLKRYKGLDVFVSLAHKCPNYSFSLIVSSPINDIKLFFSNMKLPYNLHLIAEQNDLLPYYLEASLLLNLSLPGLWVETFGLTLLEGMQFGIPCIAPDFGGPREIIFNGENGFLINPYNEDSVIKAIDTILNSESNYIVFVKNVLRLKERFSVNITINILLNELNALYEENLKL